MAGYLPKNRSQGKVRENVLSITASIVLDTKYAIKEFYTGY